MLAAPIRTRDLGSENLLTLREFPGHVANSWRKLKVFGVPGVWHAVRTERLSRSGSIITRTEETRIQVPLATQHVAPLLELLRQLWRVARRVLAVLA